jgi:hypothetical protein
LNNRQQETGARLLPPAACWSNQNYVFEFQDPFDFRFDLVIIMHWALSWNSPEMFIPA